MRRLMALAVLLSLLGAGCGDDDTATTQAAATSTDPVTTTTAAAATTEASTTTTTAATTTEASTTTSEAAEPLEVQIARESMDVWNSGDLDGWLAFFTDDGILGLHPVHSDHVRAGAEFWMVLGDQTVMDECDVWADGRIRCHAVGRDDLSGPSGCVLDAYWSFWFSNGKISRLSAGGQDYSSHDFIRDMTWWLEDAHREVWESTFASTDECLHDDAYNCWYTWYSNAETAAVLLEYRDEFIAQSAKYPLTE